MTEIKSSTAHSHRQVATIGALAVALGLATAIAGGAGVAVAYADAGDPGASPSPASSSRSPQTDSGSGAQSRGVAAARAYERRAAQKAHRADRQARLSPAAAAAVKAPAISAASDALPRISKALKLPAIRVTAPSAVTAAPLAPPPAATSAVKVIPTVAETIPSTVPVAAAAGGMVTTSALPAASATKASSAAALAMSAGLLGQVVQAAAAQGAARAQSRRLAVATSSATGTVSVSTPAQPVVVDNTNSFTTIYGTTAAGSVTLNGHTWVADPESHLYSTTANLAQEWQSYYTQMKAGQGAALTDIQRLEGNAEAVFENTRLRDLSAIQLSTDRQDVQRVLDSMSAAMVIAGVNVSAPLTQQQYLAVENVMRSNATLEELAVQGHGLNNSGFSRYAGYTNDFQNGVDGQTLYIGGGLNNGQNALARFFDDSILTHMPFPTVVNNGVLWQLNQNGNRENSLSDAVTALNAGISRTYLSGDFLQPPRLVNKTPKQAFTNGQAFSFTLAADTFVDPQGQRMTYQATLSDGTPLPSWVSFDSNTARLWGTPPAGTTSSTLKVTATNSSGLYSSETFGVQFKDPALVIANQTPTQKAAAGKPFSFTVPASTIVDPLGQTLTYTATLSGGNPLPAWLAFDARSGLFSGTAPTGTKSVSIVLTAVTPSGVKASEGFAVQFTA